MTVASQTGQYLERPSGGGLVEVVDLILDKGLVIDVYARVSLVGIELLTIDARIVVASVDTYLRFAEAVNRLDLARSGTETRGLPGVMEEIQEGGSKKKTKGALEGVKDTVGDLLPGGGDDEGEESADADEDGAEGEADYEDDEGDEGEEGADEEPEPEEVPRRGSSRRGRGR